MWVLTRRRCALLHPPTHTKNKQANGGGAADINRPIGVSDAVLGEVTAKWEALSKQRKKRPLPEVCVGVGVCVCVNIYNTSS